jgi:hypothetical protein
MAVLTFILMRLGNTVVSASIPKTQPTSTLAPSAILDKAHSTISKRRRFIERIAAMRQSS